MPISFSIPTNEPLQPTSGREPVELVLPGEEDQIDAHPNCPGSVGKPQADPGFVCVYSATLHALALVSLRGQTRIVHGASGLRRVVAQYPAPNQRVPKNRVVRITIAGR